MLKTTALEYYGGDAKRVADVLGITRAAVYMWPEVVPKVRAYELERATGGAICVDPSLYPRFVRKPPTEPDAKPSDAIEAAVPQEPAA